MKLRTAVVTTTSDTIAIASRVDSRVPLIASFVLLFLRW